MDLIRIFATTAFADISERYLTDVKVFHENKDLSLLPGKLILDEAMFVDEARIRHPELSDDQLRMIFGLYRDEWCIRHDTHNSEVTSSDDCNIFNILFRLADELIRIGGNGVPVVRFKNLFRWRELTQTLGENLFTSALWAFVNRNSLSSDGYEPPVCSYPTVLHNDNPHLLYLFEDLHLAELHSHLYAATDNFGLSWICLMNHIKGQYDNFLKLASIQDPSRQLTIANRLVNVAAEACAIRITLWKYDECHDNRLIETLPPYSLDAHLEELDRLTSTARIEDVDLDYIYPRTHNLMSVFAGERLFLFRMFDMIIRGCDVRIHELFYRYILLKNYVRSFLVQVNGNLGFSNFKRFQDVKSFFLLPQYKRLLSSLPIWEAVTFNFTDVYEARVTPHNEPADLEKLINEISKEYEKSKESVALSVIYHFIKRQDDNLERSVARDNGLRSKLHTQSVKLDRIIKHQIPKSQSLAIDAASSELFCRPEVFAQSFRFLKAMGFKSTFHAGEDFYDLADGLRAIFEAIWFLDLEAGDRIGHAIALGLNPYEFYAVRHNCIVLPKQWMLDNVVWLYFYARKSNVVMEPSTEEFLLITYRRLMEHIGYESRKSGQIDIRDYFESILLRGDNPDCYDSGTFKKSSAIDTTEDKDIWNNYRLSYHGKDIMNIREFNSTACSLYYSYHFDKQILRKGKVTKSFQVPEGYADLIFQVQEKMIQEVSKLRLGIECCPSSNFKIARLCSFDRHPIFRFMPVEESESRYPLSVTVNTDDLGIFATSLPNEFSLLTLALLKKRDSDGRQKYSSQQVYDWIERVIKNGHKFHFRSDSPVPFEL